MAKFALSYSLEFLEPCKTAFRKGVGRAPHTVGVIWSCCQKRPQSRVHSSPRCWYPSAVTCDALEVCGMGGRKMVKGINKRSLFSDPNASTRIHAL